MKIAKFVQDKSLILDGLTDKKMAIRKFIIFRIRVMLATDASLRDPDKPNEVADSRVSEVHEDLKIEIREVSTIYKEIRSKVMTDPDHLPLAKFDSDNDKKRFKQKYATIGSMVFHWARSITN